MRSLHWSGSTMSRIHGIVIDCENPLTLGVFWQAVLGWEYWSRAEDWVSLANPDPNDPNLSCDRVPEAKVVKNRVHLDIRPVDCTMEEERQRLESLGASTQRLVDDNPDDIHYIMADPEGNEFCLLEPVEPTG
jgi:hypothetical protein